MNRREFVKSAALSSLTYVWPKPIARLAEAATDAPNVVVIVLDSFAARHASFLGYPRETTPHLNALANRSSVYHKHYAGGNFTTPATASLLTGCHPWTHRAMHAYGTVEDRFKNQNMFSVFGDAGYQRLAHAQTPFAAMLLSQFASHIDEYERLEKLSLFTGELFTEIADLEDYQVVYPTELQQWVGASGFNHDLFQPGSLFLSNLHRLWRGVRRRQLDREYAAMFPKGLPEASNAILFLLEETIDWMDEAIRVNPQPFLGYFHLYPPHIPYTPRIDFANNFEDDLRFPGKPQSVFGDGYDDDMLQRNMRDYDQYLAYADAEVGRLLDGLNDDGVLDNTLVAITSDHGELFERGILGHVTPELYDPLIHIPLLISEPGQRTRNDIDTLTHATDVLPSLLHLSGLSVPNWIEGSVLPPYAAKSPDPERAIVVVEAKRSHRMSGIPIRTTVLRYQNYKLLHYLGYEEIPDMYELYDLAADPHELNDLFGQGLAIEQRMLDLFSAETVPLNTAPA